TGVQTCALPISIHAPAGAPCHSRKNAHSFASLEILEHLIDKGAITRHQARTLLVLQKEAQPLGATQAVFGHLVQARQVLDDSATQKGPAPEITGRTIDQEKFASIVEDRKSVV